MRVAIAALSVGLALILALAALSAGIWQNWGAMAAFGLAALAALPFVWRGPAARLPRLARGAAVAGLVVIASAQIRPGADNSIYTTTEARERFHALYAEELARWPIAPESRFLQTSLGRVHVVVSGPEDAPPMLLLHASAVGGWSWRFNAEALGAAHRIYAIDLIGDAGLSEYEDLGRVLQTGADQAALYAEIMDGLGLVRAVVVGASEGGFIASNLALHHPDRVSRLILLGPMGYAGATRAALRITAVQLFPLRPVRDATFRWAFSDDPRLIAAFDGWFTLAMTGMFPAKVPPFPLSAEERAGLSVPTLFVFGTRDNVVGAPERAAALVADMPNARVEIVEAGHLMAAEDPATINRLILDFAAGAE